MAITLDTVTRIDAAEARLHLASGRALPFDALIVSTGSAPRRLDPTPLTGLDEALSTGRLSTLHSMADASRVRDALAQSSGQARVIIFGAGLVAAETSSLLQQAGHDVLLVARSVHPGVTVLGYAVAARITELHRSYVTTHFGRTPRSFSSGREHLTVTLDNGTRLAADLMLVALGTIPAAPAPWRTGEALHVDSRLRYSDSPRIYAAGGVADHHVEGVGAYRIDHWEEAAMQGTHAAQAALHDFGLGDDPGPYRPRSTYSARIYGSTVSGAGLVTDSGVDSVASRDPLVVLHRGGDGVPVGVIGIDATQDVHRRAARLHSTG